MSERRPMIGVVVVVMHQGNVLLTQREDFHTWCLPGGGIDPNESIVMAGAREVREETGIEVHIEGQVGICSRPWRVKHGDHVVVLAATPRSQTFAPDPAEVVAVDWFAHDALPQPMMLHHAAFIRAAVAGSRARMWSSSMRYPAPFMERGELYRWRDASGLRRAEAFEELVRRLGPFALTDDLDGTIVESYPS